MPYRNMTLEELAKHIGMDARVLRKWAERGKLPGQMVGGEWRFNRAQMLDWYQREIHGLDEKHIRDLERAMSDGEDDCIFGAHLPPEAIDLNLPAKSRASVLRELVKLAECTGLVYDPVGIVEALEEREKLCSTALPGGLAFPHPRRPLPYATAEPLLCIAHIPAGIPFGAPDGRLTDLFVFICSHEERQHLKWLARLALMFSTSLPHAIREAEDPKEALMLLLQSEEDIMRKAGA